MELIAPAHFQDSQMMLWLLQAGKWVIQYKYMGAIQFQISQYITREIPYNVGNVLIKRAKCLKQNRSSKRKLEVLYLFDQM